MAQKRFLISTIKVADDRYVTSIFMSAGGKPRKVASETHKTEAEANTYAKNQKKQLVDRGGQVKIRKSIGAK